MATKKASTFVDAFFVLIDPNHLYIKNTIKFVFLK
tara:strand:+ start:259 stop:363 length:105 start_codon:yes stop_codon:yes gene_type:complete